METAPQYTESLKKFMENKKLIYPINAPRNFKFPVSLFIHSLSKGLVSYIKN